MKAKSPVPYGTGLLFLAVFIPKTPYLQNKYYFF
jgi:hypothetical protein